MRQSYANLEAGPIFKCPADSKQINLPISSNAQGYLDKDLRLREQQLAKMISDADLYQIAIFLGSASMALIILYHYLEVNAQKGSTDQVLSTEKTQPTKSPKVAS